MDILKSLFFQELYPKGNLNPESKDYLWLPEFEFLTVEKTRYYHDVLYADLKNVIPFAINGAGDIFGMLTSESQKQGIVFYTHDPESATLFAPNMPGAVFRRIMEFACGSYADFCSDEEKADMDEWDAEDYTSETEAIEMLVSYRKGFGEQFPASWNRILDTMVADGFAEGDAFVSYTYANEVILQQLGLTMLHAPIHTEELRGNA